MIVFDSNYLGYASNPAIKGGLEIYEWKRTEIIYGFLLRVLSIAEQYRDSDVVFAWDSRQNYRRMVFRDYKRKRIERREQMSDYDKDERQIMLQQMEELRFDVLPALGFKNVFYQTGYEGDDIVAQIVNIWEGNKILVSADKDLWQLVRDGVVCYNPKTKEELTEERLCEIYGFDCDAAEGFLAAKYIGGCDSDAVPGIKGVRDPAKGKSSKAIAYVKGELTKGKIFDRIVSKEGRDIVHRNKKLICLPFKYGRVPLNYFFRVTNTVTEDKLRIVFDRYHFISFLEKKYFDRWVDAFVKNFGNIEPFGIGRRLRRRKCRKVFPQRENCQKN